MDQTGLRSEQDKIDGKRSPELTIVMPCLNEVETLGACIQEVQSWARETNTDCEVIVADNGSSDGSVELAMSLGARVVNVARRGYGAALDRGIRSAKSNFIVMADSDQSYNFGHTQRFYELLKKGGVDLVVGNRFLGEIEKGAMPMKNRLIGNPVLSWLARNLFSLPIGDFHCGMRGVRKSAYEDVNPRSTGMEWATEMIVRFSKSGKTIDEVPTDLRKDGRSRPPHLRPWRDGFRHLYLMLLLRPLALLFWPSVTLFVASVSLWVSLMASGGSIQLGGVTFGTGTVIVVSGFTALFFLGSVIGYFLHRYSELVVFSRPNQIGGFSEINSMIRLVLGSGIGLFMVGVVSLLVYTVSIQLNSNFQVSGPLVLAASSAILTVFYLAFGLFTLGAFFNLVMYGSDEGHEFQQDT